MKKLVTKSIKVLLILLILISALFACEQNVPDGNGNPPEDESGENQPSEDNTQAEAGIELTEKDADLVAELTAILSFLGSHTHYDIADRSFEQKIDTIKSGNVQPLLVDIDSENYYFVVAYYTCEKHSDEDGEYYCVSKYTWVKYENANDIKESYEEKDYVAAFQINVASLTEDILTGDKESKRVEHISIFRPNFSDGANTNAANLRDHTYIYLCKTEKATVYYSLLVNSNFYSISCMCLDEKYYIPFHLYTVNPNGERLDSISFEWNLGNYYDTMIPIMITDKYIETTENGWVRYYGLFEIEEFVNEIIRK